MCASDKNKGSFNSIFYAVFESSNIVGSLMSASVIAAVNQSTFYLVMTVICVAASLFFLFLKKPIEHP